MTAAKQITLLPVDRKDIEHPSDKSRQYLTEAITDLARLWIAEGRPLRILLTISGYDEDSRELYEIPEVCQWAKQIANEFPVFLFFLDDISIDRFVGWLCGPVSKQAIASREFAERYNDTKMEFVANAVAESSDLLEKLGADRKTISQFYFQISAERAD